MNTQDKLAEALRELFSKWLESRPAFRTTVEVNAAWEGWKANTAVAAMLNALDEQAQAHGGEWVMVPREPTEGMLKAAEDAVDAASNCESTTDDLSAIAYKAALATAPQLHPADPVAWRTFDGEGGYDYRSYEDNETYRDDYIKRNGPKYTNWVQPLYLHPQPAKDAKDAARMEWYFGSSDKKDWLDTYMRGMREGWSVGQWRAAIDAAMAKESGR